MSELIRRAAAWPDRAAVDDGTGVVDYGSLLARSAVAARGLLTTVSSRGAKGLSSATPALDLEGRRVCALLPPGMDHVVAQWAAWRAGGIWVPLALSHPPRELAHVLSDAEPCVLIVDDSTRGRAETARDVAGIQADALPVLAMAELAHGGPSMGARDADTSSGGDDLPVVAESRPALMIYTSGTTGSPKGVVTTHANVTAQVRALVEAWGWSPDDRILHVLPLHHVHGIVNVLCCALWSGARCVFERPDPVRIWERFAGDDLTLFMAVPTVYRRLIRAWDEADVGTRGRWSDGARSLRLMVSGSAALPVPTLHRWREITGQTLLERYGMTEIGMGLSNPLRGERRAGTVGQPLPGVQVKLVNENGDVEVEGEPGEIHIRGGQVFTEYWRRPESTQSAFSDGWFKTGDEAVLEDGYYRILGRQSVDIIKTGGFKVSALEIEAVLREHPEVADVAVVGVADPDWGERVSAALVTVDPDNPVELEPLRTWAKERLAPYKVPSRLVCLRELPRNAMGKVVKPEVAARFQE